MLGLPNLLALAAGGVLGSGWLLEPATAGDQAGPYAIVAWLVGGAVMAVIGVVMVELGRRRPKNGGLIFWPYESSGPYVATVVAAGLWIFYALNPVSEAAAITKGLTIWVHGLYTPDGTAPTWAGIWLSAVFIVAIAAVNFLAPRLFLKVNFGITVVKVIVPVLVVVLLFASGIRGGGFFGHYPAPTGDKFGTAMSSITGAGVIYAYIGFQAPLDFAGKIRKDGMGETARLRWAVFGTIAGSVVLYTALQVVFLRHLGWQPLRPDSPYTQFALAASMTWFAWLIRINALLSPAGSGMVFSFALTREVEAFSRTHLVHRGLQAPERRRTIKFRGRKHDVLWVILIVDTIVGMAGLLLLGGVWKQLIAVLDVLTLVVYTMPAVALVTFSRESSGDDNKDSSRESSGDDNKDNSRESSGDDNKDNRTATVSGLLARLSFILAALILYLAGWDTVWPGMVALSVGTLALVLPPYLKDSYPGLRGPLRRYDAVDAQKLVANTRNWRRNPAVQGVIVLLGYLAALLLVTLLGNRFLGQWGLLPTAFLSYFAFELLVGASCRYRAMTAKPVAVVAPAFSD